MTRTADASGSSPPHPTESALRSMAALAAFGLLVLVLLYLILRELAVILRPLCIALFLCYLFVPLQRRLGRIGIPAYLTYTLALLGAIVGIYAVGVITYPAIAGLSRDVPEYVRRLETLVEDATQRVTAQFRLESLPGAEPVSAPAVAPGPVAEAAPLPPWRLASRQRITALTQAALQTIAGMATSSLVVLFYTVFLLLEQARFARRVEQAFGYTSAQRVLEVAEKINVAVARYITVKTYISLLVAVISYAILAIFGVRYSVVWALITFLANFIPYVGSIFAVLFPILISFIQFDDAVRPIAILVLLFAAQQATGSLLEPRVMGRTLDVSPLLVLLSLGFWGLVWGVPGMILSVPLLVSGKIVLEHIPATRPLARLISNG